MEQFVRGRSQRKWHNYIKAHVASRILSGIEKETPLHEETLTLSSESDVEERTVGSETSLTPSSEFRPI